MSNDADLLHQSHGIFNSNKHYLLHRTCRDHSRRSSCRARDSLCHNELRNQIEELRSDFLIKSLARQKVGANEAGEESPIETARSTLSSFWSLVRRILRSVWSCWSM